jgi:hypothetical protein
MLQTFWCFILVGMRHISADIGRGYQRANSYNLKRAAHVQLWRWHSFVLNDIMTTTFLRCVWAVAVWESCKEHKPNQCVVVGWSDGWIGCNGLVKQMLQMVFSTLDILKEFDRNVVFVLDAQYIIPATLVMCLSPRNRLISNVNQGCSNLL